MGSPNSCLEGTLEGLLLLAPSGASTRRHQFGRWSLDDEAFETRLAELQRLRGQVYLEEGAITGEQLNSDGRHRARDDERSWHLLTLDSAGRVEGCVRFLQQGRNTAYSDLAVRKCPLATSEQWGSYLRRAVEQEIARSKQLGVPFYEVGGWALTKGARFTRAAFFTALGVFALGQLFGGGMALATATMRNKASTLLKRIGGHRLRLSSTELPPYFDPHYGCYVELLAFNSGEPSAEFARRIEELRDVLRWIRVVAPMRPDQSFFLQTSSNFSAEAAKAPSGVGRLAP